MQITGDLRFFARLVERLIEAVGQRDLEIERGLGLDRRVVERATPRDRAAEI
jgi:hypothetical protein